MALPIVRTAFALALPTAGTVVFRPGDRIGALDYSTADSAVIAAYAAANPGAVILDGTPFIDAALPEVLALRLRAGDPVGEYQASQDLLDTAYIQDHP